MTAGGQSFQLVPATVDLVNQLAESSSLLAADRQWWWPLIGALQKERLVTVLLGRDRGVISARISWTQAGAEAARRVKAGAA
jgi:hypothetical protein